MRNICRYRFYVCVIQFYRDVFSARNVVFDLLYQEERFGFILIHFKTTAFPVVMILKN